MPATAAAFREQRPGPTVRSYVRSAGPGAGAPRILRRGRRRTRGIARGPAAAERAGAGGLAQRRVRASAHKRRPVRLE